MKKKLIIHILALFLTLWLNGQTEKGKWLYAPTTLMRGWAEENGEELTLNSGFFSSKLMYFPLNRVAFGGQLQYAFFRVDRASVYRENKLSWWFLPTVRYYFTKPGAEKRIQAFAEVGGTFFFDRPKDKVLSKSWGSIAGFGMDYFLNDRVIIECVVAGQYRWMKEEVTPGLVMRYQTFEPNLQLGLRFFLQPAALDRSESVVDQSVWLFGAWVDLNNDDDGALNRHPFFFRGKVAYFVVPSLAVGIEGGIDLAGNKLSELTLFSDWEAGVFLRYYLPTAKKIHFFPEVSYSASDNIYKGFDSSRANALRTGIGAHTFLSDRIALESVLSYRLFKFYGADGSLNSSRQNNLTMDINLVFFLMKN